jgi:uncharacterized protein (TIGR03067 family)
VKVGTLPLFAAALLLPLSCSRRNDPNNIQGTWTIQAIEFDGKAVPAEEIKNAKVVITADKIIMTKGAESKEETYKLDPGQSPRGIDLTVTIEHRAGEFTHVATKIGEKAPAKKSTPPPAIEGKLLGYETKNAKGIYALEGDTLKICVNMENGERPKEFSSKPGLNQFVMTLKRQ